MNLCTQPNAFFLFFDHFLHRLPHRRLFLTDSPCQSFELCTKPRPCPLSHTELHPQPTSPDLPNTGLFALLFLFVFYFLPFFGAFLWPHWATLLVRETQPDSNSKEKKNSGPKKQPTTQPFLHYFASSLSPASRLPRSVNPSASIVSPSGLSPLSIHTQKSSSFFSFLCLKKQKKTRHLFFFFFFLLFLLCTPIQQTTIIEMTPKD